MYALWINEKIAHAITEDEARQILTEDNETERPFFVSSVSGRTTIHLHDSDARIICPEGMTRADAKASIIPAFGTPQPETAMSPTKHDDTEEIPVGPASIEIFGAFDLRKDAPDTYSVHAHGATMATIVKHQDRWVIQWTGRNLGTWDHPIQAFRGLVMHCIN